MNVLEKINFNGEKGDLITLISPTNSGTTSLLCLITRDLVLQGKHVVYLSDDYNGKNVLSKFGNLIPLKNKDRKGGSVIFSSTQDATRYINEDLLNDTDVVILDGYFGNKDNIKELAYRHKIMIIETKQTVRDEITSLIDYKTKTERSDIAISLRRTRVVNKLSLLDKFKNKFCFWIPEIRESENLFLNVIKNRRGGLALHEIPMNFSEINKK